jgi:hypothetical protein
VLTPNGGVGVYFRVRAIDNEGLRDPNPPVQAFKFRNHPPVVTLTTYPNHADRSDTTFASVTLAWNVSDPDGDATKIQYQVWLDGRDATPDVTMNRSFTIPSDRFQVGGAYTSGFRTVSIRAIDDGGLAGTVVSVRWYVRQPAANAHARLLIVDDMPAYDISGIANTANFRIDTLYANTAARNLPAGSYSTLQLLFNRPFKSAKDLEQTFKLFDGVVWYRGNEASISPELSQYEDGLRAYLDAGGRFYLDGLYLFRGQNADGALSEDFVNRYLDCNGFRKSFVIAQSFTDSTIGINNRNNSSFFSTLFADSCKFGGLPTISGGAGGVRAFNVKSASDIAFMAPPTALTPAATESLCVAAAVPQANGGKVFVSSLPIGLAVPINANPSARFLGKVFGWLGLVGP